MKNLMKFLGIAALVAVTSFSMIACDNGGGTGNNPGNNPQRVTYTGNNGSDTYTLVITENTSRAYTPVNGDTYKLTLTGGKTSTGTIVISGGTITLTPLKGGTITVEVLGTSIVSITGTGLRWDDDTEFNEPGTLSNSTVGNPYLGKKLVLSGQVYKFITEGSGFSIPTYEKFDGDFKVVDNDGGGSGEIKGGKLSYTIETPTDLRTLSEWSEGGFDEYFDDVKISDHTVKLFYLYLDVDHDTGYSSFSKDNITGNIGKNTASLTWERLVYIFFERDVTWSGKGKTFTEIEHDFTTNYISKNFSFPFKAGWNVICFKQEASGTFDGTFLNPSNNNITVSLGEPSGLKWAFMDQR